MEQQLKVFNVAKKGRVENMNWARSRITGNCKLVPYGVCQTLSKPSFEQIANAVTATEGYKLIGFYKSGWGGHAVGAYVTSVGVWFMDPNYGEYTMATNAEFIWFMRESLWPCYKNRAKSIDQSEIQTFVGS